MTNWEQIIPQAKEDVPGPRSQYTAFLDLVVEFSESLPVLTPDTINPLPFRPEDTELQWCEICQEFYDPLWTHRHWGSNAY